MEVHQDIYNKKYCFINRRCFRFIFKGLTEDLEKLRMLMMESGDLSFISFASAWRELQFSSIFANRYTISEIMEYSEGVLHYAKGYVFATNIQSKVFGIYTLYAIHYCQPVLNFRAKPRFTLSELKELKSTYISLGAAEYREAQVIITRCFTENIYQIVATQFDAGIEIGYGNYFQSTHPNGGGPSTKLPFDPSLLENFEEVSKIYTEHKKLAFGESEVFNSQSDFLKKMNDIIGVLQGPKESFLPNQENFGLQKNEVQPSQSQSQVSQPEVTPCSPEDIGERRQALKMKSFKVDQ